VADSALDEWEEVLEELVRAGTKDLVKDCTVTESFDYEMDVS